MNCCIYRKNSTGEKNMSNSNVKQLKESSAHEHVIKTLTEKLSIEQLKETESRRFPKCLELKIDKLEDTVIALEKAYKESEFELFEDLIRLFKGRIQSVRLEIADHKLNNLAIELREAEMNRDRLNRAQEELDKGRLE